MKTPKGCVRVKMGRKIKLGDFWGDGFRTEEKCCVGELLQENEYQLFRPVKKKWIGMVKK
jgi:hypothetical protein